MKRALLLVLPISLFLSCMKNGNSSFVETISNGSKWGLQIGSSPTDVYSQLQQLSKEKKGLDAVEIVTRHPFSKPEDVTNIFKFYGGVSLVSNSGRIAQVIIYFKGDTINSIDAGGGLPDEVSKWPMDVPDVIAIHKNDPVSLLYDKLVAIYKIATYENYVINLTHKPLDKPFDPDMANNDEWDFDFFIDVKPGRQGHSSVRLLFKNGALKQIIHSYSEADVFN